MPLGNAGWVPRAHFDSQGGFAVHLMDFRAWSRNSGSCAVHLTELTVWLWNSGSSAVRLTVFRVGAGVAYGVPRLVGWGFGILDGMRTHLTELGGFGVCP